MKRPSVGESRFLAKRQKDADEMPSGANVPAIFMTRGGERQGKLGVCAPCGVFCVNGRFYTNSIQCTFRIHRCMKPPYIMSSSQREGRSWERRISEASGLKKSQNVGDIICGCALCTNRSPTEPRNPLHCRGPFRADSEFTDDSGSAAAGGSNNLKAWAT